MATIYVKGAPVVFTVTGIGAPAIGDTYTNNGGTYTIIATSLVAGAGTITCTIATNSVPLLSASLVKATGAGNTVTSGNWSYTCASDTHYKELPASYTTGDTVEISNVVNGFVRLIIDGADAADVAAIETEKPRVIQCGVTGELLFTNASTTYPLIIPLDITGSGAYIRSTGYASTLKVRGDFIEVYTSDGTRGQSFNLNFPTLNGMQVDNPPFLMAEADVGAGALVSTLPTVGATYTNNSSTFTVSAVNITDGEGDILCTRTSGTNEPQELGLLTKATGTGDATLGFRRYNLEGTSNYRFEVGNAWMPLLNIGGKYANRANTAYVTDATSDFSEWGRTYALGHCFECDEYNGGAGYSKIYLGKDNLYAFGTGLTCTTSPAVGDTYTNNGQTFTVVNVQDSGSGSTKGRVMSCSGTGAPTSSGTLTRATGAGDATITFIDAVSVGGWVPPLNAKVRMPNIHFTTAGVAGTTASARAQFGSNTYQHSNFDMENCGLSDRIGYTTSSWGFFANLRARNVGQFAGCYSSAIVATEAIDIKGWYQALDKWISGNSGFTVPDSQGTMSVDRFFLHAKGNVSTPFGFQPNTKNITRIGEIRVAIIRRITTSYYSVRINELRAPADAPITITPLYCVGHRLGVSDARNVRIYELNHSDSATGVVSGCFGINAFTTADQCENVVIEKVRRLPSGSSPFSTLFTSDALSSQVAVHDIVYDCLPTGGSTTKYSVPLMSGCDTRSWYTNITLTNSTGSMWNGSNVNETPTRLLNVFSDYATSVSSDMKGGVEFNLVGCNAPSISFGYTLNNAHFATVYTGGTRSVGKLHYAPGSKSTTASGIFSASVGTEGADYSFVGSGSIQCPGIVTFTSKTIRPLRGIRASATAFSSAILTTAGTSITGLTYEARLCKWGDDITAVSFVDITSQANCRTNMQSMLDTAITAGYTPEIGLNIEYKVSTSATQENRSFTSHILSAVEMATTFTSPEVGYIEVAYTGVDENASVALIDDNVITHYTALVDATETETYEVPYDFTGTDADMRISKPKTFKLVARKAGYAEAIINSSCYQAGITLPMAIFLNYAVTDTDVSDISVNGVSKTFTITASKTSVQAYQKAQWWAHQEENMNYDIPLTTNDGISLTQPSTWTFNGIEYLTSGTIIQGTVNISSPATITAGVNGVTLVLPEEGTYSMPISSSIVTFAPTTNAVTYILSSSTITGELDLRNTHATRTITVQLPAGASYITTNNTGGAITVTAPSLERGQEFTGLIAGSLVKVFTSGTTTEKFSTLTSGTSETWDDATSGSIDVDYVIMKAGYLPIRVTGVTLTGAVGTGIQTTPIVQTIDRAYVASSGLTWSEIALDTGNKYVKLNDVSTVQNLYSFLIEQWIDRAGVGCTGSELANVKFPMTANGSNSFSLIDDWETRGFTTAGTGISNTTLINLSRDGLRYVNTAGTQTSVWSAILTSGVPSGALVRYQQSDAGTTVDAIITSGNMDELVHVYGDASHGNFDKRGYLVLKVQEMGYDQAESDVVALYGNLDDQLFVVGLAPTPNGIATGDPALSPAPTISQGTYVVDAKTFSVKIVAGATGQSGEDILRWLRYNFETGGTFEGENAFNWHDLVRTNGSNYKTVNGIVYGSATTKGVLVYESDGTTLHTDFNLFTADNGSTYVPPATLNIDLSGFVSGTRIQIYDTANSTELFNDIVAATTKNYTEVYSVDRTIRVRASYVSGTSAKSFVEMNLGNLDLTTQTISRDLEQSDDSIYNTIGVDGSTITEISISLNGIDIYVDDPDNELPGQRIYSWYCYYLFTEDGIRDSTNYIRAIDITNFRISDNGVTPDLVIANIAYTPLSIINVSILPETSTISPTAILDQINSNSDIMVNAPIVVGFPYSSGSGLDPTQSTYLTTIYNKALNIEDNKPVATKIDVNNAGIIKVLR